MMREVYRQFQNQPFATRLTLVTALGGSFLTLAQIILLASGQDGICFSGGCEIVDSRTTIPPLYFNVCGLVFFQVVFWGVWVGRNRPEWLASIRMLLLAGLAAEGVLISFQQLVVEAFCTYCLIIFSLVILLNLLGGLRQAATGATIFAAVVIAFSTLQFTTAAPEATGINALEKGTYAVLPGEDQKPELVLFFSSTCPHCEKVIRSMRQGTTCAVRFNPVSKVTSFPLTDVIPGGDYSIDVNRSYLTALGRKHIPVLLVEQKQHLQLISGGNAIMDFLDNSCRPPAAVSAPTQSLDLFETPAEGFVLQTPDASCSTEVVDCEEADEEPLKTRSEAM